MAPEHKEPVDEGLPMEALERIALLRESEIRYRTLFEHAIEPIFIVDNNFRYIDVNPMATEVFGYTREEFLSMTVFDVIPPHQRPQSEMEFNKLRSRGQYENFQGKMRDKQGRWRDIEVSSSLIELDGKVIGSLDFVRDITDMKVLLEQLQFNSSHLEEIVEERTMHLMQTTFSLEQEIEERKRMEDELISALREAKDLQAKNEAILASIGDGISIQDAEYRITYQNPAHKALVGDQMGRHCYKAFDEGTGGGICGNCPLAMSFMDGGVHTYERKALLKGRQMYIEVTASPLRDSRGRIVAGIEVVRDRTEKKRAEAEREELIAQKDLFISRLGHDIKTPLTPLVTLLPLVRNRIQDPKAIELLDIAIENVNTIKELAIKTIKLARVSSKNRKREVRTIALRQAAQEYVEKRRYIIDQGKLSFSQHIKSDIAVSIDPSDLEEIFYNLITNAVKYTRPGGRVDISASHDDQWVTVSVHDTGIGLTPEQARLVFEDFYKVDESRHELDSSGLGLAICRKIAEGYGGRIWVESMGPGMGACFSFTVPRVEAPKEA